MKDFCTGIAGLLHQLKKEYFREVFEYYLRGNGSELQQKAILTESNIKLLKEELEKNSNELQQEEKKEKGEFSNSITKN